MKSRKPVWYLIKRGALESSLDFSLKEQCETKGMGLHFGSPLKHGECDVIATGPRRADGIAREWVFETGHEDLHYVIMDDEFAPGGYAYLFICKGHATMTVAILRDFNKLDAYFAKTRDFFREKFGLDIRNPIERTHFANFSIPKTAKIGSALLVGEAAGFQDYMLGFGMRFAMESAWLASKSIAGGGDYDAMWKTEIGPKLRQGAVNRCLYELGGGLGYGALCFMASRTDFREFMHAMHNMGPAREALWPLARIAKKL